MKYTLAIVALGLTSFTLQARPAAAGEVHLQMENGLVTLDARDATIPQILAEWSRVGNTKIINAEKVISGPVTIQLTNVPEKQALETILRPVSGYLVAPRQNAAIGGSAFDRIMVMATSSVAPAATVTRPGQASPGQQFPSPGMPNNGMAAVVPVVPDDQDEEPAAPGRQPQPFSFPTPQMNPQTGGMMYPGQFPVQNPAGGVPPNPNLYPAGQNPNLYPMGQPTAVPSAPAAVPGMQPQPGVHPTPPNPFGLTGGATSVPGVIIPAQQPNQPGQPIKPPPPQDLP